MRGMNVTEWSAFCGVPIGCSVHLVDTGIDTGDILVTRQIDARGARSVAELRAVVDKVQVDLLGSVVRSIMTTGSLPPRTPQAASEGRQFFVMHDDLKQKLERSLAEGLLGRGPDEARSHGKIGVTA